MSPHRYIPVALVALGTGFVVPSVQAGGPAPSAAAMRSCGWVGNVKVRANAVTTCPFARNLAGRFRSGVSSGRIDPINQRTAHGQVYSPVTRRAYHMDCTRLRRTSTYVLWGCAGGTNAYAHLYWYR